MSTHNPDSDNRKRHSQENANSSQAAQIFKTLQSWDGEVRIKTKDDGEAKPVASISKPPNASELTVVSKGKFVLVPHGKKAKAYKAAGGPASLGRIDDGGGCAIYIVVPIKGFTKFLSEYRVRDVGHLKKNPKWDPDWNPSTSHQEGFHGSNDPTTLKKPPDDVAGGHAAAPDEGLGTTNGDGAVSSFDPELKAMFDEDEDEDEADKEAGADLPPVDADELGVSSHATSNRVKKCAEAAGGEDEDADEDAGDDEDLWDGDFKTDETQGEDFYDTFKQALKAADKGRLAPFKGMIRSGTLFEINPMSITGDLAENLLAYLRKYPDVAKSPAVKSRPYFKHWNDRLTAKANILASDSVIPPGIEFYFNVSPDASSTERFIWVEPNGTYTPQDKGQVTDRLMSIVEEIYAEQIFARTMKSRDQANKIRAEVESNQKIHYFGSWAGVVSGAYRNLIPGNIGKERPLIFVNSEAELPVKFPDIITSKNTLPPTPYTDQFFRNVLIPFGSDDDQPLRAVLALTKRSLERYLFLRSPEWIEAAKSGSLPLIHPPTCAALALVGAPRTGKTSILDYYILNLGGRCCCPMAWMVGRTHFNWELACNEIVRIDDPKIKPSNDQEREEYTRTLQHLITSPFGSLEAKFKTGQGRATWNLVAIACNEGEEAMAVIPILRDGVRDRFVLIQCSNKVEGIWPLDLRNEKEWIAARESERTAFCTRTFHEDHGADVYCRSWGASFITPDLADRLGGFDPLLGVVDICRSNFIENEYPIAPHIRLKVDPDSPSPPSDGDLLYSYRSAGERRRGVVIVGERSGKVVEEWWVGTASEMHEALIDVRSQAVGAYSSIALGQKLQAVIQAGHRCVRAISPKGSTTIYAISGGNIRRWDRAPDNQVTEEDFSL